MTTVPAEVGLNYKLPTWNGDWKTFADYKLAVEFEADGCKPDDLPYLAPRLVRNLTGRAWEACVEVDREKLKKEKGYEYLLEYLRTKRGKEQVDLLGDALEKYFSSGESHRRDGENMADFEMRHAALIRDIAKAMKEVGATEQIPTEIFGWFVINKFIRLDHSDLATVKSQAKTYRLEDVLNALRRMWGGESLGAKDQERRKRNNPAKTYVAVEDEETNSAIWAMDDAGEEDEHGEDDPDWEGSQILFEDSLESLLQDPGNEGIYANFQEAKQRLYRDARRSLDKARTSRGFYPKGKGSGKDHGGKGASGGQGKGSGTPFRGRCMRCGKIGHKAMDCRQGSKANESGSGATNVGFVFSVLEKPCTMPEQATRPEDERDSGPRELAAGTEVDTVFHVTTTLDGDGKDGQVYAALQSANDPKAVLDSGASESIIGANTLQCLYDHYEQLGFNPEEEVTVDRNLHKSFVFGNDQTCSALGLATVNAGLCGSEHALSVHVVEGSTPLLLSSRWLYETGAVINFKTGRAVFPALCGDREIQLERAPSFHLLMPVSAFQGNSEVLHGLFADSTRPDPGLAHLIASTSPPEDERQPSELEGQP